MNQDYKRFITAVLIMVMFVVLAGTATAGEPCSESKVVWKQRMMFDASMRRKRADISQKIQEMRSKIVVIDKKMADMEEDIASAAPEKREALWTKHDALSEERDRISEGVEPLNQEYSRVSYERALKKLELKKLELEKRYECVLNDPLTEKLNRSAAKIGAYEQAKKRAGLIETLKEEYSKYNSELSVAVAGFVKAKEEIEQLLKSENELDTKADRMYEEASSLFDKFREMTERAGKEISKISEEILSSSRFKD